MSPLAPRHQITVRSSADAALAAALRARDPSTHAHARRMLAYARRLGEVLALSPTEVAVLEHGVLLHDLGKLRVPDRILLKPGPLSSAEWRIMRRHPVAGYALLRHLPAAQGPARIVLTHHERYDGTGYPFGLKRREIPLGARVCAVADVLDALTSLRPYRRPVSVEAARAQICSERGRHFDPAVVEAFAAVPPDEWEWLGRATPWL